jgi:hypothetical protein
VDESGCEGKSEDKEDSGQIIRGDPRADIGLQD